MGKYFSDVVDQAIEDIYYCYDIERAVKSIQPLLDAAQAGDGDASYILSRCLSGPCYSWDSHPFREDEEGANHFIRQSILQGSAAGVLGAMRCGMLTPELEEAMPFDNLQQAWDQIYEKAQAGSLFCQYMIGNTYYWCDLVRIQGRGPDDFENWEAFEAYMRNMTLECIPWFEKAFQGGLGIAGRNLYSLYSRGDKDTGIQPQKEKAEEVARQGAELGYPDWQCRYGLLLDRQEDRKEEAVSWLLKSVEQGHLEGCYELGLDYRNGTGTPKDLEKTKAYWELGTHWAEDTSCCEMLGYQYFAGINDTPQDYARAVQLFELAVSRGGMWQAPLLARCYLEGTGCMKDYSRAKWLLENTSDNRKLESWYYAMGLMYAEGLGVSEDIKRGVEYLQKSSLPQAKEALLRYKKTLFGKWVRR